MSEASERNEPKRQQRRSHNYSDAEKAAALTVLDFCKGNESEASRLLGVPRQTLQDWAANRKINEAVPELRQQKKADLVQLLNDVIIKALESKRDNPAKLSGIEICALIDKRQLLSGDPTSITESRNRSALEAEAREALADLVAACKGDEARARQLLAENAPTLSEYIN